MPETAFEHSPPEFCCPENAISLVLGRHRHLCSLPVSVQLLGALCSNGLVNGVDVVVASRHNSVTPSMCSFGMFHDNDILNQYLSVCALDGAVICSVFSSTSRETASAAQFISNERNTTSKTLTPRSRHSSLE